MTLSTKSVGYKAILMTWSSILRVAHNWHFTSFPISPLTAHTSSISLLTMSGQTQPSVPRKVSIKSGSITIRNRMGGISWGKIGPINGYCLLYIWYIIFFYSTYLWCLTRAAPSLLSVLDAQQSSLTGGINFLRYPYFFVTFLHKLGSNTEHETTYPDYRAWD